MVALSRIQMWGKYVLLEGWFMWSVGSAYLNSYSSSNINFK